jgi:hypothetical protein
MHELSSWVKLTESHEELARTMGDVELAGRLQLAAELVSVLLEARRQGVDLVTKKNRSPWWAHPESKSLHRKGKPRLGRRCSACLQSLV